MKRLTAFVRWLSGGSFGMEGGAATTVVQLVVIAIMLLIPPREEKETAPSVQK